MGYIKHQHLIITGWETSLENNDREKLIQWIKEKGYEEWIAVSKVMTNGYWSAIVWADGSKEGWESSDEGNVRRNEFGAWCRENLKWSDMAYITFDEYDEYGEETKQWMYESASNSKNKIPNFT